MGVWRQVPPEQVSPSKKYAIHLTLSMTGRTGTPFLDTIFRIFVPIIVDKGLTDVTAFAYYCPNSNAT
jgi:hypothetical protein